VSELVVWCGDDVCVLAYLCVTVLSLVDVEVGVLQQFADNRLDVFADVARLRQRRTVTDCKRHIQTPRQYLS